MNLAYPCSRSRYQNWGPPRGVPGPLFPWNKLACSHVPKKLKMCCFLMFPVPQYCLCSPVPIKIWPLFPCSPEINALFPLCSQKTLWGPQNWCLPLVSSVFNMLYNVWSVENHNSSVIRLKVFHFELQSRHNQIVIYLFQFQRAITPKKLIQSYCSCILHAVLWCFMKISYMVLSYRTYTLN